ncbi:MAG: CocE/NonD family hydrolase [Candidatus Aminicenantes bacterium]|nr:CocE/NonD family hydrolase [Candidatus Aminicenantes bacterium]NIM78568.1 CocE/NonD family hydrolase [Candidatus Aminicenantes bacterium]NIN17814.1 CocE/NonD family hydrolase [Candidatus Aminicenantes bacterium]NIN41718.1 CocE/NonD family hydrolase [Candidatus Aminicenantes bacterium]NIN84467.1 CocE/NonD family hydrolase [Candidatus Aminicenantes bacterium]
MKSKTYHYLIGGFIVIVMLLTLNGNCSNREKPSGHILSNLEDEAAFTLYVRETPIGTIVNSIDKKGNYHRKMRIAAAGQEVEMTMDITPDKYGDWKRINIVNPMFATIHVQREGNRACYRMMGQKKCVKIPEDYVFYDDFGNLFESVMLKKYDMVKKGKQTFQRFRIPEEISMPGSQIRVELEFMGEKRKKIKDKGWEFLLFNYKLLGTNVEYWVGKDFKIYMIHAPVQYAVSVREGFEELLPFKTGTSVLAERKRNITIPMRDGVKLSTDLYFPDSKEEKYPVILIRTPYKKEMNELDGFEWAKNGYVCAIQDVRGRFASGGEWEPFVNEAQDGYDTIEWLAAQEWCSGKVGMIGGSYLGWVQLQAAVQKPPHLVTIIPNVVPPDPFFNIPYEYGSFFTLGALWWVEVVETEATADISGKRLIDTFKGIEENVLKSLPVVDLDKKVFGKEKSYWRKWVRHNTNDSYWERANYLDKLEELDIPVFLQSGWFDGDAIGTKLSYLRLKHSKNKSIKMIVGPWGHSDLAATQVVGQDMGEEAGIDLLKLYRRWFDYWLKGIDTKILEEPLVQLYAMNTNKWLKADTYPLPGTRFTPFYLTSGSGANTLDGDGRLQRQVPVNGKDYDEYEYNPGDPTPGPMGICRTKGQDSYVNLLKSRNDILVYNSEQMEEPLTIVGPLSVVLYASSSAPDTDWFVSFEIIKPDGEAIPLCKGTIRARFRNSFEKPEMLEKDKIYKYTIDLWHAGITLEKGSVIRIDITSAFFPWFSLNLNTGGHNEMESKYVSATQRIYHNNEYPSHLLLPVVKLHD